MIVDYSTARPSIATLQAFGITAVGRYLGWDCEAGYQCIHKNLTKAEAATLLGAGIQIFLSFEYAANAAAKGAAQGTDDAQLAHDQLIALGMVDPASPVAVYYAVDFDIPDYAPALANAPENARAKLGPVATYFDAIHATRPNHEVAAYGPYWAISRLLDAKLITKGWQTIAWSGGQWDSRAVLRQELTQVFGADVDVHTAASLDFGQWPRPAALPDPPVPHPAVVAYAAGGLTVHQRPAVSSDGGKTWVTSATPAPGSPAHPGVAVYVAIEPLIVHSRNVVSTDGGHSWVTVTS